MFNKYQLQMTLINLNNQSAKNTVLHDINIESPRTIKDYYNVSPEHTKIVQEHLFILFRSLCETSLFGDSKESL